MLSEKGREMGQFYDSQRTRDRIKRRREIKENEMLKERNFHITTSALVTKKFAICILLQYHCSTSRLGVTVRISEIWGLQGRERCDVYWLSCAASQSCMRGATISEKRVIRLQINAAKVIPKNWYPPKICNVISQDVRPYFKCRFPFEENFTDKIRP